MNFAETIALHRAISILPFRCTKKCPIIAVFDNQKQGYAIKLKKPAAKCCHGCCVRELRKSYNFRIMEDEKYLTFY